MLVAQLAAAASARALEPGAFCLLPDTVHRALFRRATMQRRDRKLAPRPAALSEEIVTAPEAELRALLANPAFSCAAIVLEVRDVITNAIGESDDAKPPLIGPDGPSRLFLVL